MQEPVTTVTHDTTDSLVTESFITKGQPITGIEGEENTDAEDITSGLDTETTTEFTVRTDRPLEDRTQSVNGQQSATEVSSSDVTREQLSQELTFVIVTDAEENTETSMPLSDKQQLRTTDYAETPEISDHSASFPDLLQINGGSITSTSITRTTRGTADIQSFATLFHSLKPKQETERSGMHPNLCEVINPIQRTAYRCMVEAEEAMKHYVSSPRKLER